MCVACIKKLASFTYDTTILMLELTIVLHSVQKIFFCSVMFISRENKMQVRIFTKICLRHGSLVHHLVLSFSKAIFKCNDCYTFFKTMKLEKLYCIRLQIVPKLRTLDTAARVTCACDL